MMLDDLKNYSVATQKVSRIDYEIDELRLVGNFRRHYRRGFRDEREDALFALVPRGGWIGGSI
ncbi:hypothetical protein N7491_001067 [Penicillium cf. griseofulvum]|uniref:Uncharacterized protein n=1 Tax=Penicillium cf. griseofulvum TaxID=2972120 RepID=A0A9W9M8H2_9EURO|nr:hypothetical protein N7472_006202 [Penicillium cf. griseofulvum]KAJ5444985.1 hypothetical protein N7491_001067 [Penicillium cf. griseofulvum]KAJ5446699.1 hypothetical protein N7445_001520 [Penicillium cf. griseofulvum]